MKRLAAIAVLLLCIGCRTDRGSPTVTANDDWDYYGWNSNAPPLLPVTNTAPEIIWRDPEP